MKVYNQNKTIELTEYDLEKGELVNDTLVHHYEEIKEIKEEGHYETIAEYPNGGKDVKWVVDVEGVEYQPARDEEENIYVYIPYTEKELKNMKNKKRIDDLRFYLNNTWSWQMERYNAEKAEMELGIRLKGNYTISLENLIISRKDAVDEINRLEEEMKQYEI